jgi:threonine-phosphate decarboxylase
VVSGWDAAPDGRHHGAHGALAAQMLGAEQGDLLDFSANINPLGPPEGAILAAEKALRGEAATYPDPRYPELRAALGGYLGVSLETVLPTNGGAEALFLAARVAVEGGGRRAVILDPTFSEYAAAARAAGLKPESRVARLPERGFRLDFTELDDLDDVSLVFLCNPNNPTGDLLPREDVMGISERVRAAGAVFLVDEAFADFAPGESVAGEVDENLYVARSFTKFFGIPGLRLGCLVTHDPDLAGAFQPSWPVNVAAAAAGISAAKDSAFAEETVLEVERRRRELFDALEGLEGITPYPGAANFLLFRGPKGLPEHLARLGVLVRGCDPFPGLGPGFIRVAVRGREENYRLVRAMREALDELRGAS